MNKTISVNISGRYFHIDESAFKRLDEYLSTLKSHFLKELGGEEVIGDLEQRVSELFSERLSKVREVVNIGDVEFAMSKLGTPEDFGVNDNVGEEEDFVKEPVQEKKEEFKKETSYDAKVVSSKVNKKKKIIFRDSDARIIGGVCSGLSHYFGIDKLFIRIVFLILTFAGIGFTIPIYIILWAIIPKARSRADKLKMKGDVINLDNIERKVKEEMGKVENKVKDFTNDSKTHRKMRDNLKDMVSDVEPYAKIISGGFKQIAGLFLLLLSSFWMIIVLGLVLQVPLIIEILVDKDLVWLSEIMHFYHEISVHSSAYSIGSMGLIAFVFLPLIVCFMYGSKLYFSLQYKFRGLLGVILIVWLISIMLLVMAASIIGFELLH
jgi:phage shock protein PspC (stress-responsive transcriptional regulator)